jgi:hypothetical protein
MNKVKLDSQSALVTRTQLRFNKYLSWWFYLCEMKSTSLFLVFLLIAANSFAQNSNPDPKYQMLYADDFVSSKNYYLLNLIHQLKPVKALVEKDAVLVKINTDKRLEMEQALKNCGQELSCLVKAMQFNEKEIGLIGDRLTSLYRNDNALGKLLSLHIIPSGHYVLFANLAPKEMLRKAWEQDAKAINHTIAVYAGGKKPNYPNIDSLSYKVSSKSYLELLQASASLSLAQTTTNPLFFAPSLLFALQSLELDERNQVADFEPMERTVNKAAYEHSKTVKWEDYKYSLILVPGAGPDKPGVALSGGGMLRCRLAALQYHKGLAPFIMVSGGAVHPYKTKFNEAQEMKKYLMKTLNIPEQAILMEPHARHTTTNMRNASRLIFRYGFPMEKPAITSTLKSQSYYITDLVPQRSEKELGYRPYKNGQRLSDTEAEFYPLAISLQLDFDEPMDP